MAAEPNRPEAAAELAAIGTRRLAELVQSVGDEALRAAIGDLLVAALQSRASLSQIDLKPFEAAHYELAAHDIWEATAPQFMQALQGVAGVIQLAQGLSSAKRESALDEQALDMAFAEMDGQLTPGDWVPPESSRGQEIDDLLERLMDGSSEDAQPAEALRERCGLVAWQVASLLRDELSYFRRRLGMEAVATDRWNLLGDLQETRHKLIKGIGALVVGVCSAITPVRKDEVLPGYLSELGYSLQLRSYLDDLREHVALQRETMRQQPEDRWAPLAQATYRDLERAIFGEAFGLMRPLDKRALIELRNRLRQALERQARPRLLAEIVDDTVQFLEALRVINSREVLIEHDQQSLNMAVLYLEAAAQSPPELAGGSLRAALGALATAAGRDRDLDTLVKRATRGDAEVSTQELLEHTHRVLAALTA